MPFSLKTQPKEDVNSSVFGVLVAEENSLMGRSNIVGKNLFLPSFGGARKKLNK